MNNTKYTAAVLRGLEYVSQDMADEVFENVAFTDKEIEFLASTSNEDIKMIVDTSIPTLASIFENILQKGRMRANIIKPDAYSGEK